MPRTTLIGLLTFSVIPLMQVAELSHAPNNARETAARITAQQTSDRGALAIRRGTDTLVVDRFIRIADTLKGSIQVRGQPRLDYFAVLGPNESVLSLQLAAFAPGAAPNAEPASRIRFTVRSDTVIAETPAGVQRAPSKVGAIPMFMNALALMELSTRRARASGGVADIPHFAVNGGAITNVTVRPAGSDTLVVNVANRETRFRVDPSGRILGGVATGSLQFIRLGPEAAEGLNVAVGGGAIVPPADYSAPSGAPYSSEEVRVTAAGGIVLGGTLTKPNDVRGLIPAVVTVTGSGLQDRDGYIPYAGGIRIFRQIADTLSRRGIAVLRLDDRGLGASTGSGATATSADFADDIRAAVAYLRARQDIDPERIAIVGHSEGGAIAPMVAATDARIRAIVVMAGPGEAGIEISMAQNKYIIDRDTSLTQSQRDSLLRVARAALDPAKQTLPWLKFWLAYNPATAARQVKAPTLIMQGATDRQVPADQAEKLAQLIRAGGNNDVTVRLIPSTNHLFVDDPSGDFRAYDRLRTNKVGPGVLGPLADWLALKLSARAGDSGK